METLFSLDATSLGVYTVGLLVLSNWLGTYLQVQLQRRSPELTLAAFLRWGQSSSYWVGLPGAVRWPLTALTYFGLAITDVVAQLYWYETAISIMVWLCQIEIAICWIHKLFV